MSLEESKYLLGVNKENPFLPLMHIEANMIVSKQILNNTPPDKIVKYKDEQYRFVKYFEASSQLRIFDSSKLSELIVSKEIDPDACRILMYIMCNIGVGSSSVTLSSKVLIEELGYSKGHYQGHLKQLVKHKIIAKKSDSLYWINPMFFFNGNRLEEFCYKNIGSHFGMRTEEIAHFDEEELIVGERFILKKDLYLKTNDVLDFIGTFYRERHLSKDIDDVEVEKELDYFLKIENGIQFTDNGAVNLAVKSRVDRISSKLKKVRQLIKKAKSLKIPKLGK